jgi:peptidoglycan/LPS O-acetylase OafA/YrhL
MIKRLLLLNGLAIIAVVSNHAASWGYQAMFYWTLRYSSVTPPDFEKVGTLSYYVLAIFRHLSIFSVPSFLFVSGFFIAYAARGRQKNVSWKIIGTRIWNLVLPYIFWNLVLFVIYALLGQIYSPIDYLLSMFLGRTIGPYFFVPLLIQFLLLAPFLVPWARNRPQLLLALMALLQLVTIGILYIRLINPDLLPFERFPNWLFTRMAIYFPFGIVFGFHLQSMKKWLAKVKWGLLIAFIVLAVLVLVEQGYLYQNTELLYGATFPSFSAMVYALVVILCYLAFEKVSIPFAKSLNRIGNKSYGIYLVHPIVLMVVARGTYHFIPNLLAYPVLFLFFLIICGIGVPLLLMEAMVKTPARKLFRYVFG